MSKPTAKTPSTCPVCASHAVFEFWEMQNLPVRCNVLCRTPAEALAAPRGDIRLAACEGCGFIWNAAFEAEHMAYDEAYENSLHFSPRFQAYANKLADRLVGEYDLHDKDIVEIACGQGDFLRLLCERGNNRGLGFDPSYRTNGPRTAHHPAVTIIQGYYDERYANREVDLVCCRHALEHMPDPVAFLRMVRRNIARQHDTVVFFEVPNVLFTLRGPGIWDIIYEHCGYFCPVSLARCFRTAGFDVMAVSEEYEGQFACVEARPGPEDGTGSRDDDGDLAQLTADTRAFGAKYQTRVNEWTERLDEMRRAGQRAVVWGAGSKGVTFLNVLRPADQIEYVVDINPRKHGKYVAGTGQRIVAPEALREHQPDAAIVMNPVYQDEVRTAVTQMKLSTDLLVA